MPAAELNLSQGLAGSLIDTILETRIREDARNGVNREENRRKRVETALEVISAKKKRYSAGLHVSAQRYLLGPDVLDDQEARQQQQEDKASERLEKKLQEFRALKSKVTAIRALDKRTSGEDMTVAQLKTMVTWYKRSGDLPIPATRTLFASAIACKLLVEMIQRSLTCPQRGIHSLLQLLQQQQQWLPPLRNQQKNKK